MNVKFNIEELPSLKKNQKYNIQDLVIDDLNSDYTVSMFSNKGSLEIQNLVEKTNYKDIFCFLYLPYWQKPSRIVDFYSLNKYLQKKEGKVFNFLCENKIISQNENHVMYSGVVKVSNENLCNLLDLVENWKSGIFFSLDAENLQGLVSSLNSCLQENELSSKNEKASLINCVTSYDEKISIVYPEFWDEFNEYYLNVFNSKQDD